jgi:hypothetical protein
MKTNEWSHKAMTIGLECWIEDVPYDKIAGVSVEVDTDNNGLYRLRVISNRTLAFINRYGSVYLNQDQWEDRPHDPYDSTVLAIWALGLFDLIPAAIDYK